MSRPQVIIYDEVTLIGYIMGYIYDTSDAIGSRNFREAIKWFVFPSFISIGTQ